MKKILFVFFLFVSCTSSLPRGNYFSISTNRTFYFSKDSLFIVDKQNECFKYLFKIKDNGVYYYKFVKPIKKNYLILRVKKIDNYTFEVKYNNHESDVIFHERF